MAGLVDAGGYRSEPRRSSKRFDLWLLSSALLLLGFGLLSLYGEGQNGDHGFYFHKQVLYVLLGIGPVAIFGFVKPRFWIRATNLIYAVNVLSLIAVFKLGVSKNGSERWIPIAGQQFQPSEMAKLLLILTLSAFYAARQEKIERFSTFALGFLHMAVPMVLVLKQPHVGGAIVMVAIWAAISIGANVPIKYLVTTAAIGVVFVGAVVIAPEKFPMFVHGYHENRLNAFLGRGEKSGAESGILYQTTRAKIAFGVGGVIGTGIGKGEQGAHIPEQQTDFIFTVPGEELGLVGCSLVLGAFGFLFFRIWLVMLHATEAFSRTVVAGVLALLAVHTFVNLFSVTQMLPVIGLWLPFMSYGGTAMWLCMACIALVLNIRSREPSILFGS